MTTKIWIPLILLCGPLLSLPQVSDPNVALERLERLNLNNQQNHFGLVNEIIKELNNRPNEGTEASLRMLGMLNSEEETFLERPCDQDSGMHFLLDRTLAGKNPFLKADLFEIIVRLSQNVSPSLQEHSLQVMVGSFTPSTYDEQSVQLLTSALVRMGKQSVPSILKLGTARKPSERWLFLSSERSRK